MRNVLMPQGSEQTAKEGERQRKDREKKLENQRAKTARKQDGSRTHNSAVASTESSSDPPKTPSSPPGNILGQK